MHVYVCMYVYERVCTMDFVWRSEENLQDLVFSFYHGVPQNNLWSSGSAASTYLLGHIACPSYLYKWEGFIVFSGSQVGI